MEMTHEEEIGENGGEMNITEIHDLRTTVTSIPSNCSGVHESAGWRGTFYIEMRMLKK